MTSSESSAWNSSGTVSRELAARWRSIAPSSVSPVPRFANYVTEERGDLLALGSRMPDMLDPAASWTDVAWLRSLWSGPLLLKGVLHPDEARAAIDHGVDAVLLRINASLSVDHRVAMKPGGDSLLQRRAGQQIAS